MNNFQAFLDTNPNYYRPNAISKNTFNYTIKVYFCLVLGLSLLVAWNFYSNYHDAWWMDLLMFMLAMLLGGLSFGLLILVKYRQFKKGKYPRNMSTEDLNNRNFKAFLKTNPSDYFKSDKRLTFRYNLKSLIWFSLVIGGLFALKTWSEHAPIWEIVLSGFIFPLVFWLLYTPYIALKYYQYKTGKYPEKVSSPA